eukprot:CAMPEP_0119472078 /NCGR_PEP_ID=MMETSP1344-20130328/4284_1 /TAXON_ID=236787 /ORGANISM="Florenciella parvula, Strain CCMP2471" /LENGTH=244 /DNA_ID=CAMNT_0007504963 /DNA_START=78 /DNA_END=812 /DNA_ORIENTATION=-
MGNIIGEQKKALLNLKAKAVGSESVGGKAVKKLNWSDSTPLDEFDGVTCDLEGNIVGIDLSGSAEVGLTYDLNDIVVILGPHLKEIQLGNNKNVTGDLSVLSVCTSIAVVSMPFTSVTGDIEVVTHWPQLAKLDLQDCVAITGDIIVFSDLSDLSELSLYNCAEVVGDVSAFQSAYKLSELKLRHCNKITGDSAAFEMDGKGTLSTLAIEDCPLITGEGAKSARWLPQYSQKANDAEGSTWDSP